MMKEAQDLLQSLRDERNALSDNIFKLQAFLWSDEWASYPEVDDRALMKQLEYMLGYQSVLQHRIRQLIALVKKNEANGKDG